VRILSELRFRLRQESANAALRWFPPSPHADAQALLRGLPDPSVTLERLRGTPFAREVERLAEGILAHRFPLLGGEVSTGPEIRWRRDPLRGLETSRRYFRFIPYLDRRRAGDHKIIWELNRHQHLVLLAQACRLTGRREFCDELQRQVESWLLQNPFHRGINWASALEVGLRALAWVWVFHLAGAQMGEAFRGRFLTALYRHGCHLEHNFSHYFSRNTHLIGEAVALHALGTLFPEWPRAAQWARQGAEVVHSELAYQVLNDGAHFERSSYYHVYALDFFLFNYLLSGRPIQMRPALERMGEYLEALLGPGRAIPLLGDDDGGRVFHPYGPCAEFGRATLATCALVLGRDDWPFETEDLYPQAVWWLGEEAWRAGRGQPPRVGASRLFADAGLAVMAAGPLQVIVDAGPFGAGRGGHSHSDTLSLVVRRGAEEILVDAGTCTYVAEPAWRDWFRGTAAHNTVRVNEAPQAEPRTPFGWHDPPAVRIRDWSATAGSDFLDAICSYRGFTHRRRVLLLRPALLVVLDDVEGTEQALVEQFWHAGQEVTLPAARVCQIGPRARLVLAGGDTITCGRGGEHGWRSRVFGRREEAPFLCVSRRGRLPASLGAVLEMDPSGPPAELNLQVEGDARWLRYEGNPALELRFGDAGPPEVIKC